MTGMLKWMLITADPGIAQYAQESGVHRIFVDMEVNGKAERQGHLDTHKAAHTFDDVSAVRQVLESAELMVRVNPLYDGTASEVAQAVECGADRLMLPMFSTRDEIEAFSALVPSDTTITYLAETPAALVRTRDWASLLRDGDEVHYGLNDLGIAMGLDFLFEPLAADLFSSATECLTAAGIPFGIGGIARPAGGELPARVVLGEHVRLGCSWLILSRAFHGSARTIEELTTQLDLAEELAQLRHLEAEWHAGGSERLRENQQDLVQRCFQLAANRRHSA